MNYQSITIIVLITLAVVFSPIYLQRRKLWRMANEDLKRIDENEWRKQIKSNTYIRFFSRIIWGLFLLSGFIINPQKIIALGFNWLTVFVSMVGIAFIIWGILAFRSDLKKLSEIK